MTFSKMHADEVDINASLVGRLLAAQFSRWEELPLRSVSSAGTDNAIYRLGEDMVVRLPRTPAAAQQVEKEQRWLPRFAPLLPLDIPVPLVEGKPGEGYPWPWSVYRWIKGETTTIKRIADPRQAAVDLARFIATLRQIDPADGPPPGEHNFNRGEPLANRDVQTRATIASLRGTLDVQGATAAWESALRTSEWNGEAVWIHGDLQPGNLLVRQGRLGAVIDFGGLGVGDPACDLMVAWNFLSANSRDVFRAALNIDDETWERGRGWALSVGVIALPYYRNTNPVLADISRYTITEVLADGLQSA